MPVRPTLDVKKEYMLSSNPIHVEANLDKAIYYHGQEIKINVSITNSSSRQVSRVVRSNWSPLGRRGIQNVFVRININTLETD